MKKYKHKKTGEIATYENGVLKSSGFCVEIGVEPSKEFWEEVKETYPIDTEVKDTWTGSVYKKKTEKEWIITDGSPKYNIDESQIGEDKRFTLVKMPEKDYEILSFINKGNDSLFHKAKDGKYSASMKVTNGIFEEKELLSKPHFRIYSVRRLSDNEVFTIGQDVFFGDYGKIKSITINSGICYIGGEFGNSGKGFSCVISFVSKAEPVLFTTEDGVNIRKGDEVFIVELDGFKLSTSKHIANENWDTAGDPNYTKKYKRFSSKEKAEDYILMNKPCLSIMDIENIPEWDGLVDKLKLIVKGRLK